MPLRLLMVFHRAQLWLVLELNKTGSPLHAAPPLSQSRHGSSVPGRFESPPTSGLQVPYRLLKAFHRTQAGLSPERNGMDSTPHVT